MNPGSILIGLALLIATVPWVINPLLKTEKRRIDSEDTEPALEDDQHTQGLIALRDLEFDHNTGKVSEEDYLSLRANLLTQIAAALEYQEAHNTNLDALLEEKILARRKSKLAARNCDYCGSVLEASDRICRSCGAPVDKICSKCGSKIKASDRFCNACGAPVSTQQPATPMTSPIEST